MKRVLTSLMLLALALILTSCSSIDDFVVINRSDSTIEVTYIFLRTESGKVHTERPQIMEAVNLKKSDRLWESLPSEQYVIDSQTGRVSVRLAPGKALLLKSTVNYRKDSDSADARFGISSLIIMGAKGTISLEGRQARMLFRYEEKAHVITYE